jgi:hypothetical protein
MILTALPTLSGQTKSSIQQNISQILQLHEELLAELHQVVPLADFTMSAHQETYPVTKAKHPRPLCRTQSCPTIEALPGDWSFTRSETAGTGD